jgi:hypothetical protein
MNEKILLCILLSTENTWHKDHKEFLKAGNKGDCDSQMSRVNEKGRVPLP